MYRGNYYLPVDSTNPSLSRLTWPKESYADSYYTWCSKNVIDRGPTDKSVKYVQAPLSIPTTSGYNNKDHWANSNSPIWPIIVILVLVYLIWTEYGSQDCRQGGCNNRAEIIYEKIKPQIKEQRSYKKVNMFDLFSRVNYSNDTSESETSFQTDNKDENMFNLNNGYYYNKYYDNKYSDNKYSDYCMSRTRGVYYNSEHADETSDMIDKISSNLMKNHTIVTWRRSIIAAIFITLVVLFIFCSEFPHGFTVLITVLLIFMAIQISANWFQAHWWLFNDYKIDEALQTLRRRVIDQ